jgi:hypothetical protein
MNKESIPGGPCSVVAADLVVDVTEHVPPFDVEASFWDFLRRALERSGTV